MYHEQECFEVVSVDDVCGDVEREDRNISATWTFYHIRSAKGTVTIKWYGTSNGYYSESVGFFRTYDGYR